MVTDITSGEINAILTPGDGVNVTGSKIKIAGGHPGNGLYLMPQAEEGNEIPVPKTSILNNGPSKIVFIMPAHLPAGEYKLKIITRFTTGAVMFKGLRTYYIRLPVGNRIGVFPLPVKDTFPYL